ncbi:MAG: AAA family ATPase, partial [Bacillota bacterium]
VGEAVSPHDLYILIDKVNPEGLLVPSSPQWSDAALALAKNRMNLLVFVSGPITAEEWNHLAQNRIISVSADPADATKNVAAALSRMPANRFRFEDQYIQTGKIATLETAAVIPTRTIAVFSAKGGVGKTTIAENMAAVFGLWARTQTEKTGIPIRVALLDFNLDGSSGVYTWCPKGNPKTASLWRDLDESTLRWQDVSGAMNYHENANVWYLAPPFRPDEKLEFNQALIETIMSGCKRYFHIIIVDNGVALLGRDASIAVLSSASDVLLISDFTYKTMRLLADCFNNEISQLLGDPSKASLVINRVQPKWFSTRDFVVAFAREIGTALPLKGELPEDPSFSTSEGEIKGTPLACILPDADFSHAIAGLCRAVSGVDMGWQAKKEEKRFKLFSWVKKGKQRSWQIRT